MSEAQRLRDIEGSIRALGIRQEVVERRLGKLDGSQVTVITVEEKKVQDLIDAEYKRIAQRDQFAATAPITLDQVLELYGDPDADMREETVRVVVYGLWAIMRYEYADAMMAERRKTMFEAAEKEALGTEEDYERDVITAAMRSACTNFNKTDVIDAVGEIYDAIAAGKIRGVTLLRLRVNPGPETTVAEEDGWLKWPGGECPVAWDTAVDVEFRDRTIVQNCPAEDWGWNHHGHQQSDIVAYRVVRS